MKSSKTKRIKKRIAIVFTAMLCVAVFVITFADSKYIPNWDDIFKEVGLSSDNDESQDFVKVIDVGQGDSILIYSNGHSAVIDAGLPEAANDICLDLSEAGVNDIDAMLITHLHTDHVGGLRGIIKNHNIRNLIIPDLLSGSDGLPAAKEAKDIVVKSKGGVYTAVQGMNFNIGEFVITVLAYYPEFSEENDKSIVTMAEIDGIKFLLSADAEAAAENEMLKEGLRLDCDVLKVGHHGSNSSSKSDFLDAASPQYAAISVGTDNMYSHPNDEVLTALESRGIKIFRTDRDGDITFFVENGSLNVETEN